MLCFSNSTQKQEKGNMLSSLNGMISKAYDVFLVGME